MKWVRTFRSFGFKFIFSRVIKTDNYKLTLVYPNILKWEWTFVAIWKSICKIYWNDINVLRKAGIAENIYYLFEGLFLGSKILICLRDSCFCPLKLYIGFCLCCFKTSPGIILKCALWTEVNGTNLQKFKRSPHTLNDLLTRVFRRGKKTRRVFLNKSTLDKNRVFAKTTEVELQNDCEPSHYFFILERSETTLFKNE